MIVQYLFHIDRSEDLPPSRAYAFYSCLMSLLPEETALWLHQQSETPVSQCLYHDRESDQYLWRISILGDTAVDALSPILDSLEVLHTTIEDVHLTLLSKTQLSAEELIDHARQLDLDSRAALYLLSPLAFKHSGSYTILPEPRLIVQSLLLKWNNTFPQYPLDDDDAWQMLIDGLRLTDLSIRSTRYPLKGTRIPGITGSITLDAHMAAPIQEIWKLLLQFAPFCGIGIKTALGMGGVNVKVRKSSFQA